MLKVNKKVKINPFQPSIAFHIETGHLICSANQLTGFYMKYNNWLEWVNVLNYCAKYLCS